MPEKFPPARKRSGTLTGSSPRPQADLRPFAALWEPGATPTKALSLPLTSPLHAHLVWVGRRRQGLREKRKDGWMVGLFAQEEAKGPSASMNIREDVGAIPSPYIQRPQLYGHLITMSGIHPKDHHQVFLKQKEGHSLHGIPTSCVIGEV